MIWGLSTETFTLVHVILSLVGIGSGSSCRSWSRSSSSWPRSSGSASWR